MEKKLVSYTLQVVQEIMLSEEELKYLIKAFRSVHISVVIFVQQCSDKRSTTTLVTILSRGTISSSL